MLDNLIVPRPDAFMIVGIGGSAGGLEAYESLLGALPDGTGMAFVIVAHLSPNHKSLLTQILSWSTNMPVTEAAEGMQIEPNHVYVIAPNTDLTLRGDGVFALESPRTLTGSRHHQVDAFLMSLAKNSGPRAIGVILSGGDGDGTKGCQQIKAHGGITFAQDLSAQVDSMPLSASASGCVDMVMAPSEISAELVKIGARFRSTGRAQAAH